MVNNYIITDCYTFLKIFFQDLSNAKRIIEIGQVSMDIDYEAGGDHLLLRSSVCLVKKKWLLLVPLL
jgi:hypothetical protein